MKTLTDTEKNLLKRPIRELSHQEFILALEARAKKDENTREENHKHISDVKNPLIYVIGDEMAPAEHPQSGKIHDSKAQFRRDTKAYGGVEVGTEKLPRQQKFKEIEPPHEYISYVYDQLRAGNKIDG